LEKNTDGELIEQSCYWRWRKQEWAEYI